MTEADLQTECRYFYANASAKVNIQFVDTHATLITRDTRNLTLKEVILIQVLTTFIFQADSIRQDWDYW